MATGAKNQLTIELYGTDGALRFDLENPNELWFLDATSPIAEQGFTRVLVTEPEHPYLEAWWPQGHVLGWENADRKSTRLNSSHVAISYAVFCLKKKKNALHS